jgi:hypothetical protein
MKHIVLPISVFLLVMTSFPCTADTIPERGKLYLDFRSLSFIKDNEYSNPIIEGYTLIGYFVQPTLSYSPSDKITLRLGAHLLGYSGAGGFSLVKPVFSTSWNFAPGIILTAGTLSGSDGHRMLDPHFNKERLYTGYSEDGLQVRFENAHLFNDTWVSWEHFIFRGDTTREMFTAGESFNWAPGEIAGFLRIEVPVQLQFKHYGGQISNYTEQVETYFNTAAGLTLKASLSENGRSEAGLSGLLFTGSCLTRNAPSGIQSGHGQWYRLFAQAGPARIEAGYWSSHDFYAPNGDFIFSSVSDHLPGVIIHNRKIITCSAGISAKPLNIISFYLGFDGYYDTDLGKFDTAFTLHMIFDGLFRIADLY